MPGRGGTDGRTGCDGSGRGPPMAEPGRGGMPPPGRGGSGRPGTAPGAPGRPGAGRLRFPVGTCDAGEGVGVGGRTSPGLRGGAGGAWPVRGSSTRRRSVGGTTRPVDGGSTERAVGGAGTLTDGFAAAGSTGCRSALAAAAGISVAGGAAGAGAAVGGSAGRTSA